MKKIKFTLFVVGLFCITSVYSQEEFFKNNTGVTVSESTNLSTIYSSGVSLHLKDGLIFSGSFLFSNYSTPTMATVGYLLDLNKHSEKDKLNALFSISEIGFLSTFFQHVQSISPTLGIMYTSFKDDRYPTSLGLSTSCYFEGLNLNHLAQSSLSLYFSQSFFARNTFYPVIGLTYDIPISHSYGYSNGEGSFLFHAGLNVRLLKN